MSSWGLSWSTFWGNAWGFLVRILTANPADIVLRFGLSKPIGVTGAPDILPEVRQVGFMTVREAFMELWDGVGHQVDMYPFQGDIQTEDQIDPTSEGSQYFFRLLSQAQIALANWKKADMRPLKFRQFYKHFNTELGVDPDISYEITRISATEFNIDPTQLDFNFDLETLESAVVLINGSYYKIMSIFESTVTNWVFYVTPEVTEEEVPSYPETITDVQFAINEFDIVPSAVAQTDTYHITIPENTFTLHRIDDYLTQSQVEKALDVDELATKGEAVNVGTPAKFLYLGDKIIFDTALAQKRWYKIEIFRQPFKITDLDQGFEIPPPFHQAMIFWCLWKVAMRERNEINMGIYRRSIDKELLAVRDEYDQLFDRSKSYGMKLRKE